MDLESYKLDDMIRGWFIGNFSPTLYQTNDVEVAIQQYKAGDVEALHYHKIATEFTVIVNGRVEMNGNQYTNGDIIKISPLTATDFRAITDVTAVVVKIPGANNDKYIKK